MGMGQDRELVASTLKRAYKRLYCIMKKHYTYGLQRSVRGRARTFVMVLCRDLELELESGFPELWISSGRITARSELASMSC